jgi:Winged helix-turn helix
VSREKLSPQQWARLAAELRKGPLAHGFAGEQLWTLGRIKTLIGKLFHLGYTVEGVWKLMRRHGWSLPSPGPAGARVRRGRGRGVEGPGVARYKCIARDLGAFICFEDEAGEQAQALHRDLERLVLRVVDAGPAGVRPRRRSPRRVAERPA